MRIEMKVRNAAEDSQKEIQDLAAKWNEIIAPLFSVSWKALTEEK